jgi:hypothetical protein
MDYFNERFGQQRQDYFHLYFTLSQKPGIKQGQNQYFFDYSMYKPAGVKKLEALRADTGFLEFVVVSKLFHTVSLAHLKRFSENLNKLVTRINYELTYLKYGTPKKTKVTLYLEGYQDMEVVLVSGDFNSWRPDGSMLRTPSGWERSFYLFPGSYEYKFIIGGEWILDPANPNTVSVPEVQNENSVLIVAE